MKTLIKINSIFGKLIFEYECENNTIKKTVEEAFKEKINLSYANLSSADLRYANLRYADLSYANLRYADLSSANLRYADLSYALNKETALIPIFCKWSHSIIGDNIKIGCKTQSIIEWDIFFKSSQEYSTERNTQDFKQIEAVYLAYKAYLTHLKK